MKSSTTARTNQQVTEIAGAPAQVWGNMLVPSRGTITVKITGDTVQGTVRTVLEKKESWTRIQNIDSVEILQGPIYALLAFGISTVFFSFGLMVQLPTFGLIIFIAGIAAIAFSIMNKRRCLAIYSNRHTLAVFMNKPPETYQQFAMNVLALARQLNAPAQPMRQPQPQQPKVEAHQV